jgi:hypothetical protein
VCGLVLPSGRLAPATAKTAAPATAKTAPVVA